jgi:predicted GH43/DUF377 family glycosyl hydrolase
MRVFIVLVVFLYATSCASKVDGEEDRKQNGRYDETELRKLATKGALKKYAGNPVLEPGAEGQWDSWTLATMNVLKVGDTCHMYYEAGSKGVIDFQIGHAVSADGIHWMKDPANPVIPFGEKGEWDDSETWDPFVLYEDGKFKMWYGGTTVLNGKRDFQIGYATSRDGTHFTKKGKISHYARGNVGDMHVVGNKQSGKYYMYYLDRNYKPSALLCAESLNEIDFDFDNAVRIEVEGEENGYRCPHVFIDGGLWYMYYGFKYEKRAGYATSANGVCWKTRNTVVIEGDDPEILKMADNLYLLFYCPTEYHMGHEPGCDIRVAVFEGNLNEFASTEHICLYTATASHDLQKEFSVWRDEVVQ